MLMNKVTMNKLNLSYYSLYDLKSQCHLNAVLESKITILLDDLEKEVNKYGYGFRLSQRTQKFKLYKN